MVVNYTLVFVAALVQFILGALWYSVLFGKVWMEVMEATQIPKQELKKMQKEMMPFYGLQFLLTLLTTVAFVNLAPYMAQFSLYHVGFWIWIGFIVPTQIGAVVWANTKKKYWLKQIVVMVSYQLVAIMMTAWILSF